MSGITGRGSWRPDVCGRFVSTLSAELLAASYGIRLPAMVIEPRYNIAPGQPVLIVRESSEGRELAPAVWGLIPSWTKDPGIGRKLSNARAETIDEKPSFRAAFRHRRCIVPASGFYEWQTADGKSKQPWYISAAVDGMPLSMAALWEVWQSPDGSEIESCAIITTLANDLMSPIHDRMPVILPQHSVTAWLNRQSRPDELLPLLTPCPTELLSAHPVSTLVNNPRNTGSECLTRV